MIAGVRGCPPKIARGQTRTSRKAVMSKKTKSKTSSSAIETPTLATVRAALKRPGAVAGTRLRDMQSAVTCVARLLGNEPEAIPLDMEAIGAGLGAISPPAVGMTAKRFAN